MFSAFGELNSLLLGPKRRISAFMLVMPFARFVRREGNSNTSESIFERVPFGSTSPGLWSLAHEAPFMACVFARSRWLMELSNKTADNRKNFVS
jgi:hypothetical protein